jgi:hypothetical protein
MDRLKQIKTVQDMKKFIDEDYGTVDRTRMLARLVENQGLDSWMTHELMEKAVRKVEYLLTKDIMTLTNQTRDQQTSTTASADFLDLRNTPVDSFFNFQSMRFDDAGKPFLRHQNRPDGMFMIKLNKTRDMVLFYEGDVHEKDSGKSIDKGCTNSHKMYQYIAQAQSKNLDLAGSAIFAAMLRASTNDFVGFLDDMLKAHILACLLIVQYNLSLLDGNKNSVLHALYKKLQNFVCDFVIGINIKTIGTNLKFTQKSFEYKINKMLRGINKPTDKIEFANNVILSENPEPGVHHHNLQYNSLEMTISWIPRAPEDYLKKNQTKPAFVYPFHLHDIVQFDDSSGRASITKDKIPMLNITGAANELTFQRSMMKVVRVMSVQASVPNWTCLEDTTGFFYVAIPLAYFTIELFETYVNLKWDYKWCNTSTDFKQLLQKFKLNLKDMPFRKIPVMMGKKSQNSLFNVICQSTCATVDDVASDFKTFLRECCMWDIPEGKSDDDMLSPVVFFRTLGILNLQSAIDFACETKKDNKTYTALLSSYPIGTQILIQKCMKKLTESEAYAYIERQEKPLYHTSVDEQDPSDVDDDGSKILQGLGDEVIRVVKKEVNDVVNSSVWHVTYEIQDQRPADATPNLLQKSLLDACKKASKWTITQIDNVEEGFKVPEASDDEAWKSNFEMLDVNPSIDYTDKYMVDMTVVKGIYTYCFTYNDNMYKCEGTWPEEIRLPSNKTIKIQNGQVVNVPFGNAELTFTCTLEKRLSVQSVWNWLSGLFKRRKNPRAGTVKGPDGMFPRADDSDEDDGDDDT